MSMIYRDSKIELAISTNGGDIHRKKWCFCDPLIGISPCKYCAVFNGLNRAREIYQAYMEMKEEKK